AVAAPRYRRELRLRLGGAVPQRAEPFPAQRATRGDRRLTAEQAALVQKAERSIRGARVLMEDGLHEFAVSRAYYAMFYLAEALLLGEVLDLSNHSAVIASFSHHFAKSGQMPKELHGHLREDQYQRNSGYYGTGDGPGSEQTNE